MFVPKRQAGEPKEGEYLQAIAVVVGDAKQGWIRIERDHLPKPSGFAVDRRYVTTGNRSALLRRKTGLLSSARPPPCFPGLPGRGQCWAESSSSLCFPPSTASSCSFLSPR